MARLLACMLLGSVLSLSLVGCAEKTQVKETKKVETPGGTNTQTTTIEEKKTGDNPPANP
jgi:hypothetical protein